MDVVDETPRDRRHRPGASRTCERAASADATLPQAPAASSGVASTRPGRPPSGPSASPAVLVVVGVVLRFWTQLRHVARRGAHRQHLAACRCPSSTARSMRDGAPPLYYFLLHFWMKVFGSSNLGARSLSGVISVATFPFVWIAGKRLGGAGWWLTAVTVLVSTSPFAIYYGTEARMYSLVALLTAAAFWLSIGALRRPTAWNLIGTALCTALLLYTHYWALYLVAVTGAWLVFQSWRGPQRRRRGARAALVAVVVGCLTLRPLGSHVPLPVGATPGPPGRCPRTSPRW